MENNGKRFIILFRKKTRTQNIVVKPLNRPEYLNTSSNIVGENSLLINQNSDKYSNSLIVIDPTSNNINSKNYINEIEANSDKEKDNSFKITVILPPYKRNHSIDCSMMQKAKNRNQSEIMVK